MSLGDLIAFEFAADDRWLWALGRVLRVPQPRLLTVERWVPRQRPMETLSPKERGTLEGKLAEIAKKQERLGSQKAELLQTAAEQRLKGAQAAERHGRCEAELGEVLPALEEARRLLGSIGVRELREVKAYVQPPVVVCSAIEAVLTVMGLGQKASDWDFVKAQCLSDMRFITQVRAFDPMEMTADAFARAKVLVASPELTVEKANRASKAVGPLLRWAVAQVAFVAAVPAHVKPLLDELHRLKAESARLEASARDADRHVAALESELKQLHAEVNRLLYDDPSIELYFDHDGLPCATKVHPTGTWEPARDRKKITIPRTTVLTVAASLGTAHVGHYKFDALATEAVRAAANSGSEAAPVIPPEPQPTAPRLKHHTVEEGHPHPQSKAKQRRPSFERKGSSKRTIPSPNPSTEAATAGAPPSDTPLSRVPTLPSLTPRGRPDAGSARLAPGW